jgi:protein-S-isoprenylcysteine O-methyltransferase Ste14
MPPSNAKRNLRPIGNAALCGAALGVYYVRRRAGTTPRVPWLKYDDALTSRWPFLLVAVAGWVAFSLYWEFAARNAAESKSTESSASRGVHVFLTNVALLLIVVPVRGLGRFVPVSPLAMSVGLAVETMGLALTLWSRRRLGRNWSGRIAIKVEHELVRSGPYRILRHPIYTGLLAMYLGAALVTGEWLGLVGLAMAVVAYLRKIRLEEAALDAAFGKEYAAYRHATWALVPGLF